MAFPDHDAALELFSCIEEWWLVGRLGRTALVVPVERTLAEHCRNAQAEICPLILTHDISYALRIVKEKNS